jgi:hypothetical protein
VPRNGSEVAGCLQNGQKHEQKRNFTRTAAAVYTLLPSPKTDVEYGTGFLLPPLAISYPACRSTFSGLTLAQNWALLLSRDSLDAAQGKDKMA